MCYTVLLVLQEEGFPIPVPCQIHLFVQLINLARKELIVLYCIVLHCTVALCKP